MSQNTSTDHQPSTRGEFLAIQSRDYDRAINTLGRADFESIEFVMNYLSKNPSIAHEFTTRLGRLHKQIAADSRRENAKQRRVNSL